jgi:thymidylate synthase
MQTITNIRNKFVEELAARRYTTDKGGEKTLELVGESFIADEPAIFGIPNADYIARELSWYYSRSLNVDDIPGETPQIWKTISDDKGNINSNYGNLIFSAENGYQYTSVLRELTFNRDSRRAVMIYNRPSMHTDYNVNGMSDFVCTNAVQYLIRNNVLRVVVQMRSNDVWAGFRNDFAWQDHIAQLVEKALECKSHEIIWNAASLHLYERNFWMADCWSKFGKNMTKSEYEVANK